MRKRPLSANAKKAIKRLKNETPLETVLDVYEDSQFVEVVGRAGGDTLTFRVYANGNIYER